ncbi:MAG TPA: bifunctional phosphopantothenoylcysteine decarboxylase/phosphopantothenate--cysteine ligase CoaBC [Terriglobia bacterium]|nr:bifunctional phosphopantothenoylcysteine decarboxylase/phosphopantothenate--cysteine ligase CoaBC [Terriglobia bacterium]
MQTRQGAAIKQMKIALGVSGGIACYKSAEILRRLQDRGVDVVVLMTKGATQFVTPLTFRALSGNKVYVDLFEGPASGSDFEGAFDHILVAQSIDLFLVAPATADCMARLAAGLAGDFLTTFHLAVTAPVVIAPAMNTRMWQHPSVQANLKTLVSRGVHVIDPEVGQMACRTYGPGRLAPVEEIVDYVMGLLNRSQDLQGRKVLVTAGPTVEDIDPIRYITNRSSGKMGYAIARAARSRGADVVLVAGPTELEFPNTIRVRTTEEMRRAVIENAADAHVVIKAAAPLDFRPKSVATQKIKKKTADLVLDLEPTADILQELGNQKNGKVLVGFAAETEAHIKNGLEKLKAKNLDLIVVNSASGPDSAFDSDMNHATIIDRSGKTEEVPLVSKQVMADKILDRVVQLLK